MCNLLFFPSLWKVFKIFINFKRSGERKKIKLHCVYLASAPPSLSHLRELSFMLLSRLPRGRPRQADGCPVSSLLSAHPSSSSGAAGGLGRDAAKHEVL